MAKKKAPTYVAPITASPGAYAAPTGLGGPGGIVPRVRLTKRKWRVR